MGPHYSAMGRKRSQTKGCHTSSGIYRPSGQSDKRRRSGDQTMAKAPIGFVERVVSKTCHGNASLSKDGESQEWVGISV